MKPSLRGGGGKGLTFVIRDVNKLKAKFGVIERRIR